MICLLSSLRRETRAAPAGASVAVQLGFEAANAGEPLILRVRGDCMTPLLRDGQTVAVNPTAVVWPGDVVAFLGADGRLRVHRLLLSLPTPAGWLWLTKPDRADWIMLRRRDTPVSVACTVAVGRSVSRRWCRCLAWLLDPSAGGCGGRADEALRAQVRAGR